MARVVRLRQGTQAPPGWTDEAVALACSAGDPAAIAELFDRFHPAVLRFLRRAVGDARDAEDLLQTTFLEIARGAARFEGRSQVRTWLFGIAVNVARHHLRSHQRRNRLHRALSIVAATTRSTGPDHVLHARRTLKRVERALSSLPAEQRLAFVLCEIEGMSARQAGRILDASETAVWKRVSEARRTLKRTASEGEE